MRVLRKIMAITLALTLVLSMGAMTAVAVETEPITVTVGSEEELVEAVARNAVPATITLEKEIELTKPLIVEAEVTIDGGEKKFKVNASNMTEGFEWQGEGKKFHGIIVANTNATLKNLTISGAGDLATEKPKSGFGIQIKNVEKSDVTLTLENVTIEGTKNGGGLLANDKDTTVIVNGCTFDNNAWGGIEVVPGGVLTVDDTEFISKTGAPAIWIDTPLTSVSEEDIGRITGNSVDGKLVPKSKKEDTQIFFVELPSLTLTSEYSVTGTVTELVTAENGLLVGQAAELEGIKDLPAVEAEALNFTGDKENDTVKLGFALGEGNVTDGTMQIWTDYDEAVTYPDNKVATYDLLVQGAGAHDYTTTLSDAEALFGGNVKFYIAATKAGTYVVDVTAIFNGKADAIVNAGTITITVKAPVDPAAGAKTELAKIDFSAAVLAFGTEDNQANAEAEIAKLAQAKVAPGYSVTVAGSYSKPMWTGTFTVTSTTAADDTATSAEDKTVTVSVEGNPTPPVVDKTALTDAIAAANAFKSAVNPSEDGTDIAKDKKWATQANIVAFIAAITSAQGVADKDDATEQDVSHAVTALAAATKTFEGQVKPGTKEDKPVEPGDIAVTSVTVSPATLKLAIGVSGVTTGELTATVTPDNATNKTVVWTSGKATIATVDQDGVVTAVAAGTTTITATAGGKSGTATIIVTDAETDKPEKPDPETPSGGGGGGESAPPPSQNTANDPETTEKVNDTVSALADPTKELPKDAVKTTTAGGASITTIPLKLSTGNATLGSGIFNTIGGAPATVGLKLTVSNGMSGGSAEIIIPGGFGKITEPGRFGYTMDYKNIAENDSKMIGAVKGDNAVSMTAKVGGNFTLPGTATVTVPTKLANGSNLNIYKYDPITNTFTVIGKAVVKDGKITFATKIMGEILFTTGTL